MRSEARIAGLAMVVALLASCYPSNVVAARDRAVVGSMPHEGLAWHACADAELVGFFESCAIEGDASLSLQKVYYVFVTGGRYTGAALVDGEDGLAFQTLGGSYALGPQGLSLDGADPVRCDAAEGGYVRIALDGGAVVLRKSEVR
jgi:hypothetical protein